MVFNPEPPQLFFINTKQYYEKQNNGKHSLSYEDSVLPEEPTAGSRVNTITQPLWFAPLRALNPTRSGTHLITAPTPLTRKERYM